MTDNPLLPRWIAVAIEYRLLAWSDIRRYVPLPGTHSIDPLRSTSTDSTTRSRSDDSLRRAIATSLLLAAIVLVSTYLD